MIQIRRLIILLIHKKVFKIDPNQLITHLEAYLSNKQSFTESIQVKVLAYQGK